VTQSRICDRKRSMQPKKKIRPRLLLLIRGGKVLKFRTSYTQLEVLRMMKRKSRALSMIHVKIHSSSCLDRPKIGFLVTWSSRIRKN